MNPLEKQLHSWIPRHPSAKIARHLFGAAVVSPALPRPAEVWRWLAPVAACVLTLLVALNADSHHVPRTGSTGGIAFLATLPFGAGSNFQKTFSLTESDENMQMNVWQHPYPRQTAVWTVMPTNH